MDSPVRAALAGDHRRVIRALRGLLGAEWSEKDAPDPFLTTGHDGVRPDLENDLSPALTVKANKTVRAALRLLDRTAPASAVAYTLALAHEAADVQDEVLDRIERDGIDDATRDALLRHLETLAACARTSRS